MEECVSTIRIRVARTEAESRRDFQIESLEPLSVMTLLAMVREQDATIACRTSTCFKGKCGSCLVRVNGQDVFGCTTLVKPGESILIEPHSKYPAIRDIAVDFSRPAAGGKE